MHNAVFAICNETKVRRVVRELEASGFSSDDISVLFPGDIDARNDTRLYENRLTEGAVLLSIHTGDTEQVERAKALLAATGATDISVSERNEGNEGEGSRTAARRYDEGVAATVASGDVDHLAKEASNALDDPREGPQLKDAEAKGKRGPSRSGS